MTLLTAGNIARRINWLNRPHFSSTAHYFYCFSFGWGRGKNREEVLSSTSDLLFAPRFPNHCMFTATEIFLSILEHLQAQPPTKSFGIKYTFWDKRIHNGKFNVPALKQINHEFTSRTELWYSAP